MRAAHRGRVLDEKLGPAHLVLVGVHLNAPDVMLAFKWKPSFSRCFWFSAGSGKGVIYKWRGTLGCVWWLAGSGLDQTCPSLEKSPASESHTFNNNQLSHSGIFQSEWQGCQRGLFNGHACLSWFGVLRKLHYLWSVLGVQMILSFQAVCQWKSLSICASVNGLGKTWSG